MIDYDYMKPESLDDIFNLLKEYGPRATLIAGGTDVMVKIRNTNGRTAIITSGPSPPTG